MTAAATAAAERTREARRRVARADWLHALRVALPLVAATAADAFDAALARALDELAADVQAGQTPLFPRVLPARA